MLPACISSVAALAPHHIKGLSGRCIEIEVKSVQPLGTAKVGRAFRDGTTIFLAVRDVLQ